ncbi:hypothetical protein [Haloechinothrix halophila]|uniref:hypothetical protein n=1 Tax=Haloechinothrix halophila TaxID=1069073 RepID=UPI0012F7DE02|nr:hypothetical protein [Haloechinothrix halophila]
MAELPPTITLGSNSATRLDKVIAVLGRVLAEVASIEDDLNKNAPRLDSEQSTHTQRATVLLRMAQDATIEAARTWLPRCDALPESRRP